MEGRPLARCADFEVAQNEALHEDRVLRGIEDAHCWVRAAAFPATNRSHEPPPPLKTS